MFSPLEKVLILGASGLVGSHLLALLEKKGFSPLIPSSKELDLTRQKEVEDYFAEQKPKTVFFLAGRGRGDFS